MSITAPKSVFLLTAIAIGSNAFGATSVFDLTTDPETGPVELWDAVAEGGTYGSFTGNNIYNVWCDSLTIRGRYDEAAVQLILTEDYKSRYPLYAGQTNMNLKLERGASFIMSGANSKMDLGGGQLGLEHGSSITITNGAYHKNESLNMNFATGSYLLINGGSTFDTRNTRLGNASATGQQIFRIEGSDNTVKFRNLQFRGAEGTRFDNVLGGKLEIIADANGIATIAHESSVQAFSGVLMLDFSSFVWEQDSYTFTLISATANSQTAFAEWVAKQDTLSQVIGAEGVFSNDANNIYVTIMRPVPEPSKIALGLGLAAISAALLKRRKPVN